MDCATHFPITLSGSYFHELLLKMLKSVMKSGFYCDGTLNVKYIMPESRKYFVVHDAAGRCYIKDCSLHPSGRDNFHMSTMDPLTHYYFRVPEIIYISNNCNVCIYITLAKKT